MTDTATQAADAAMAAANAANANAQYRAANGLPADQTNTTILNNPQSQQYLAQQDAARDAAKQAAAFSQPRNDLGGQQSAAFIAINNQYAQQQQNSIGSGGAYRQPTAAPAAANPYNPNSAAGIAYDVGLSGGNASPSVKAIAAQEGYVAQNNQQLGNQSQVAATRGLQAMRDMGFNVASDDTVIGRMNQYQQPERSIVSPIDRSSNAPTRAENLGYTKYDLTALDLAQSRSGYSNNLGDSKTRFIQQGLGAMQDMGFNVANPNTLNVLNLQRNAARQTPSTIDDRFYMNELQKGVENYVETSSAYHHMGQDLGISIPANRFEYQGDLAVELLKGAPQKAGDWFSPASGEMSQSLIGGEGLQQYAWRGARDGTAIIAGVDFGAGIDKLLSAEGQYGPYNILYGAPGYRGTPSSQQGINGVQSWDIAALPVDYVPFRNVETAGLSSGIITSSNTATQNPSYDGMQFTSIGKMGPAAMPAEQAAPSQPQGFVLDVAIGRLMQGQLPTAGELYNAMPIVKIAQNWTNTPGTVENAVDYWKQQNPSGTEGLIRNAGAVPFGSEIKFGSALTRVEEGMVRLYRGEEIKSGNP